MALTPLDIHNKEFPKRLKGYDCDAVDDFLDEIIREFEVLIKDNVRLKEHAEQVEKQLAHYQNLEDTINKTLVVAEETAEGVKEAARKEADVIIQEARMQAEQIIETGQVKSRRIMEENADLARAAMVLRSQVRSLLQAQLEAIDGLHDPFTKVAAAQFDEETEHR